jgi:hypothetical protein
MLLNLHENILNYIIDFWKENNGEMMSDSEVDGNYNKMKEYLKKNQNNIDSKYVKTSMKYLVEIGYLYKIESENGDINISYYAPTPKGIDMSKCWFRREENYKWVINVIVGFAGVILGAILSYIFNVC